jgi:hypothetical protein
LLLVVCPWRAGRRGWLGDDDGGVRHQACWRLRGTNGNGAGGTVLGMTGVGTGGTTVLGTTGTKTGCTLLTGVGQVELVGTLLRASKLFVEVKRTVFWDEVWAFFRADFSARRTLALFRVLPM